MVQVVAFSDSHGRHREVDVPDGDILLFLGDATMLGELPVIHDFNDWSKTLPHKHKLFIAGNHDRTFESKPLAARKLLSEWTYLENSGCTAEGLKIWGSPITSTMPMWAFSYTEEMDRYKIWDKMPKDLDILMTHTPPRGILDKTVDGDNAGDGLLNAYIVKNRPRYNFFGHIHESYGQKTNGWCNFYNVSQVNQVYLIQNPPVVVEINT